MKGLTESCTMMLIIMLFLASNTSFKIFAVPNKYVFCVFLCMFYSHSVPIAAIYFSKSVDIAPNAPTKNGIAITYSMPHILAIPSLNTLYFAIFPTFLSFTRSSPGMVTSTILTSIWVLSITTISGRRA